MSDDVVMRLIEVAEELDELSDDIDGGSPPETVISTICEQTSSLVLDMAHELEAPSVVTDGGTYARSERTIDRTFRLRCDETGLEFFRELDGSYLEAAKIDGEVEVYCGFCDCEHVLEVIAP